MIHCVLHDGDDPVAVVVVEGVTAGSPMTGWVTDDDRLIQLEAQQDIPIGHKVALKDMTVGDTVVKYGVDMGKVVAPIRKGEHAHVGEINLDQAGDQLLECMLRTANGRLTAAEALGHREFVMTRLYESA